MENLINIAELNDAQVVSARELHSFLEVKTAFKDWMPRMLEYGFEESKDFSSILSKSTGGRPSVDYALTLDTAKEISMLQRTEKGKEARQYFIAVEKAAKSKPRTHLEVIKAEMALLIENEQLRIDNERMKPRSEFVDRVFNTDGLVAIGEVAKILKLPYGRNTLFNVLREEGIFFKNKNEPYQQYVSKGYFELKEKFQERNNHPPLLIIQTFATQKGLAFIAKALGVVSNPSKRIKFINA